MQQKGEQEKEILMLTSHGRCSSNRIIGCFLDCGLSMAAASDKDLFVITTSSAGFIDKPDVTE
jgi:hypothetical protein